MGFSEVPIFVSVSVLLQQRGVSFGLNWEIFKNDWETLDNLQFLAKIMKKEFGLLTILTPSVAKVCLKICL